MIHEGMLQFQANGNIIETQIHAIWKKKIRIPIQMKYIEMSL